MKSLCWVVIVRRVCTELVTMSSSLSAAIVVLINMVAGPVQSGHQGHCSRLSSVIPLTSSKKSLLERNIGSHMNINLLMERFEPVPC